MTPIYYHPHQRVSHSFISVQKIPLFVEQSQRTSLMFEPFVEEDLWQAHSLTFVNDVLTCKIKNGFGTKDDEINRALLYSNASLWHALNHVIKNGGVACSASQGFHHAHYDHCYGYCTFNGLVIAAKKALELVEKVMIIDGDAHFGDGTEDCLDTLKLRKRVINVTRDEIGSRAHSQFTAKEWEKYTDQLIAKYKPDVLMYQAGADAWDLDPYEAGYLSMRHMGFRDSGIFRSAKNHQIPIAWNLAGGYSEPMQLTIDLHLQTLNISDEIYFEGTQ